MLNKLKIDDTLVLESQTAASQIADDIKEYINGYTTTTLERTVLRLLGIDGVDDKNTPLANIVVEQVKREGELGKGISYWIGNALLETGMSPQQIAEEISLNNLNLTKINKHNINYVNQEMLRKATHALMSIKDKREERKELKQKIGTYPWKYVIVATGNVDEDARQAKAACYQGADIIAVIRSTAQSLLDYVPYGKTTEGFGGTYATQENFRILRAAVDEAGDEMGKYIQLVNYSSGLCMPEIAAIGALERLDMMLNDAIYGILFRAINMKRTFIDQYFSRMLNAYSDITINTGEDNYLTTQNAVDKGHTVIASQFINQALGKQAGLTSSQIGLGHAFEIDPNLTDGLLLEIAQAQLIRQLFPHNTLKYMPPTKNISGDIFKGHLMNGMFNFVAMLTGQNIQLLGMLTEAIHTPFLQDRALSIDSANYIFNNAAHIKDEVNFSADGKIQTRADQLLSETRNILTEIADMGLVEAIEKGFFAGIARDEAGGKGIGGVIPKEDIYYNPFLEELKKELTLND